MEGSVLPEGRTGEVVDHVQEELANDKEGVVVNELDFMNLAPRKPGNLIVTNTTIRISVLVISFTFTEVGRGQS